MLKAGPATTATVTTNLVVSQAQLVSLLDSSRKVILDWERDGMPVTPAQGKTPKSYDLRQVLPWIKARWLQESRDAKESPALERYRTARARREELRLEQESGRVAAVGTMAAWWADRVAEARIALTGLGPALAPALAGQDLGTIAELISVRCRAICESLARKTEESLNDEANDLEELDEP